MTRPMDASKVLSGSYGKLYDEDGNWLTNVYQAEAEGEITKVEIKRSGTRVYGHKTTGVKFSGSMTGYKITTAFARKIAQIADDNQTAFVTQLVIKLDDPDNHDGKVWVRLVGVQFDSIPILKFEHGAEVTEEMPFTFDGFEYID